MGCVASSSKTVVLDVDTIEARAPTGKVPQPPDARKGPAEKEPWLLQRATSPTSTFRPASTVSTQASLTSVTLSPGRGSSDVEPASSGSSCQSDEPFSDCSMPSEAKVEAASSSPARAQSSRTSNWWPSGLLPGQMDGDLAHMGWRARAAVKVPPQPHDQISPSSSDAKMEELSKRVEEYLSLNDTPHQQTEFSTWDLRSVMLADAQLFKFVHMTLDKVRRINAFQGPRMKLVWWGTLQHLGRIPRFPEDHKYILDAEALLEEWLEECNGDGKVECESIEGGTEMRGFCLAMFSHRWSKASLNPDHAFPDTVDNKKCKALQYFGKSGLCHVLHAHDLDYYYWIDYAGINQSDYHEKKCGIAMLPAYISCAIKLIYYNAPDYEARAWTRLERVLAYAYVWAPLWVYLDDSYPEQPADVRRLADSEPHLYTRDVDAEVLSMRILDPCDDDCLLTDPRDREYIDRMVGIVGKTKAINPVFKGGGALVLSETSMLIDVLHGQFDAEKKRLRASKIDDLRDPCYAERKHECTSRMAERNEIFMQQLRDLATNGRRIQDEAVIEI